MFVTIYKMKGHEVSVYAKRNTDFWFSFPECMVYGKMSINYKIYENEMIY